MSSLKGARAVSGRVGSRGRYRPTVTQYRVGSGRIGLGRVSGTLPPYRDAVSGRVGSGRIGSGLGHATALP